MRIIAGKNVNNVWISAIHLINEIGRPEPSRVGDVRVAPFPVCTVYDNPTERVLFDPVRDANPIFHLHEALWMLAGENDATYLDTFVSDFSARFAEEDGLMHGAYGYRWRRHFQKVSGGSYTGLPIDQLRQVIRILLKDTSSRQAVIQMWDPEVDLGTHVLKDRPCNTEVLLRVIEGKLDLTTLVRSNDIVYGAYGANAVHFTVLQEYLAAQIGVGVGTFRQISHNWHMYDNTRHLANIESANRYHSYPGTIPLVNDPDFFDKEVRAYLRDPDTALVAKNHFLENTARPMYKANAARKAKDYEQAFNWARQIIAPDWKQATVQWLERRKK
jgi:thymidylate synthase